MPRKGVEVNTAKILGGGHFDGFGDFIKLHKQGGFIGLAPPATATKPLCNWPTPLFANRMSASLAERKGKKKANPTKRL